MKKAISLLLIVILHLTCLPAGRHLFIGSAFALEYMLAPSDQLEVRIIGQKDLDTKQMITPDGTISLPLLGRVTAQGQTLAGFNNYLSAEFAKYIKSPQVVIYLTPRPIYVIQHDVKKNVWDIKEAKSVDEARALAGRNYTGRISNGDIVSVEVGQKPDWWDDNWYKVLTGTAVAVGIYATLHR
jgi:polysaccharide export outer membrane protein